MTMEKISEAILDKVKAEAEEIIREAEERAQERIVKAREQHQARFDEEKAKILAEAGNEASKIQAQTSISIRLEILKAKNEVIEQIVSRVKENLVNYPDSTKQTVELIKEGMKVIGTDDVIVHVSPKDIDAVKDQLKKDKEVSNRVKEIKEIACTGGAMVEDVNGQLSIDNTYDTRLEALLPKVLPEISKELFGS